ncbi:AlpA family transcriptional regulator [Luminiphilus sp.]|nr:AlpA family transcriptional regulator [Luminiphilus sp.]
MNTTIIRLPEVIAKTGLSRSTIYFQISNGDFPRGIPIGQHARGWLNHEIEEWIEARAALRSNCSES